MKSTFSFTAKIWKWPGDMGWYFVHVPREYFEPIRTKYGKGMIKVTVTLGKTTWDTVVVFTGGLNRAFVKYLEYRATRLAHDAKRMNVQNKVQPQENTLSEFEKVSVEQYFDTIKFMLSTFHYEVFETVEESYIDNTLYYLEADGVSAQARALENGALQVLVGATARIRESDSFGGWSKNARVRFIEEGKLVHNNEHSYRLTEDIIFKSPSAAAATLTGRSINGWTAWKDDKGNTLDDNLRK